MKSLILCALLCTLTCTACTPAQLSGEARDASDDALDSPMDVETDTPGDSKTDKDESRDTTSEADSTDDTPDVSGFVCGDRTYDAITELTATIGAARTESNSWDVWANGSIGTVHTFNNETRLRVKASTSEGGGWAMMRAEVDGIPLEVVHVTSTDMRVYDFKLPSGLQGDKQVQVSYINNLYAAPNDRNLYVESLQVDCGDVIASKNLASGAATEFCACANMDLTPERFEGCATMRSDGVGTYYQTASYPLPPEATDEDGAPVGAVSSGKLTNSTIHNGASHDYWVYVPQQYDATKPAALMVFFDGDWFQDTGGAYRVTKVLDNLIARGDMPVTITVFVDPGVRPDDKSNRQKEYDIPDGKNVRFVLEELLPVATENLNISADPAHRGVGGISSGAAAALTAAWERPDQFGLVYTTLGSFVRQGDNAQGEHSEVYIERVNQGIGPKTLRTVLLSGENDLDNQYGNWKETHMNLTTAMDCAGWAYRSAYGESVHGSNSHSRTALPDNLRWLFENVPR